MSADNGYVIRKNDDGKYVLQMYFASEETYPSIKKARENEIFDTLEEATLAYEKIEHENPYASEYGLTVRVSTPPKV